MQENKFIKSISKPTLVAIIQWFITTVLQVDRLFFTYDHETRYTLLIKAVYFLFLLAVWHFIFTAKEKIKSGYELWQRGFFVFKVYFALLMLLLLILWPGTWSWDDLVTLEVIQSYTNLHAWHHFLTGLYIDVLLQVLPFPGGVIFLQNVIIALIVAFVVTKIEHTFNIGNLKNPIIDVIVKVLPFLTPPVLMYQFSGYRMGLYIYLEILLLLLLICSIKDEQEWSLKKTFYFSALTATVASWRSEAFVYAIAACLFTILAKKAIMPNRRKLLCIAIVIIGFLAINRVQTLSLQNSNYKIVSLLAPCAEVVRAADATEDADELAIIDKVTDVEVILDNPETTGTGLYWSGTCVRSGYTDEEYKNFLSAFIKLSLKYPGAVISERWSVFIKGSGITGETVSNVALSADLFEPDNGNINAELTLSQGWLAFSPAFRKIRRLFINLLGCRALGGNPITWLQRIVWNAIIPELVLLYAWVKTLVKRNWMLFGIYTSVVIKFVIIVLTEPSSWIMYVLSFYLLGYVYLVYMILGIWLKCNDAKKSV